MKKMVRGGDSFMRLGGRAALLVILSCSLMFTAKAPVVAQEEKQNGSSLELKLSAYEESVCKDSTLTLSLEITNTGQRQLKVLRSDLWRGFGYSQVGAARAGAQVGCGGGDVTPGGWIVLEPGGKYLDTLDYSLTAASFFKEAGRYKISTSLTYYVADMPGETAISSDVEFEIQDCAAK